MDHVTLKVVGDLFQEWRNTRLNRTELIPERLWGLAVDLYPEHKRSRICKHLRLCASDFKRRLVLAGKIESSDGFVLADSESKAALQPSVDVELTVQGQGRSLNMRVNINTLSQVLPHVGVLL